MSDVIKPANLAAQLHYRARGNPVSSLPSSAISNCFPGLETDFRNFWRRAFEGIVLLENNNLVVAAERPEYEHLVGHRLLRIEQYDTVVVTKGPALPEADAVVLATQSNPNAVSFMEWSNSIARVLDLQDKEVNCMFTATKSEKEVLPCGENTQMISIRLRMRRFFVRDSAAIAPGLIQPGELTQGLCAPWQNDYRECACYYWAASRPDYVNVELQPDGLTAGDQWMAKERTGTYIPDNRSDMRLWSYDDLFKDWEQALHFIVRGHDVR